jgi:hypothetical protein
LEQPGVNAAPWNIKDRVITAGPAGPQIGGQPLIFYHFHALVPLGRELFDPSLHRYDAILTAGLRDLVYRPYLQHLRTDVAGGDPPELIPPARPDDPRSGLAVSHLLALLQASELDRSTRLESLEENRVDFLKSLEENRLDFQKALQEAHAATEKTIGYLHQVEADRDAAHAATAKTIDYLKLVEADRDRARVEQQQTVDYLHQVEKDSADRLASIHFYQDKLKTAYADLERNVAYLKTLEAEIAGHVKVSADKDAIIAKLNKDLCAAKGAQPPSP